MLRSVKIKAFYIPECSMHLLSTSLLLQEYSDETIHLDRSSLHLSGIPGDPEQTSVTVPLDRCSNLPTSFAYSHDPDETAAQVNNLIAVTSDENINLSEPEKELMCWHCRLGHLAFSKVQHMLHSGVLSHSETTCRLHASASNIQRPPRCAACQFGKQKALRFQLFFKVNIFLIVYVNDIGIAYSDASYLEELIDGFKKLCGFELTREGSFADFLGIQYEHQKDGTVTLSARSYQEDS